MRKESYRQIDTGILFAIRLLLASLLSTLYTDNDENI